MSKSRIELRISGGTYLERLLARDYINGRMIHSAAIERDGEFVVTCYGLDFRDDVELEDIIDYLNSMAGGCRSTLKVETEEPFKVLSW